jgi:mannose-6-phosphate isomerase-like protein (cupin superfamily)
LNQKVCQSLNNITPIVTAHGKGEKFVFLTQQDTSTAITQFAYGKLVQGEDVEEHLHPTMEECFYFISGEGKYFIDGVMHNITPHTFFRIPANTPHALKPTGTLPLTFVYFGIAI